MTLSETPTVYYENIQNHNYASALFITLNCVHDTATYFIKTLKYRENYYKAIYRNSKGNHHIISLWFWCRLKQHWFPRVGEESHRGLVFHYQFYIFSDHGNGFRNHPITRHIVKTRLHTNSCKALATVYTATSINTTGIPLCYSGAR